MLKILVVEDDSVNSNMVLSILKSQGYTCKLSPDFANAVKLLSLEEFDLIISDIVLEENKSGYDLAEFVRKGMTSQLPIIFMSGRSSVVDVVKAKSLAVNQYIVKPVTKDLLLEKINKVFYTDEQSTGGVECSFKATWNFNLKIISVNDDGISILSEIKINPGQIIEGIESDMFKDIGIRPVPLVAVSSKPRYNANSTSKSVEYLSYLKWQNMSTVDKANLQRWLSARRLINVKE